MAKLSMFTIHPMLAMAGRTHAHTHTRTHRERDLYLDLPLLELATWTPFRE